jgi:hypothetical protein
VRRRGDAELEALIESRLSGEISDARRVAAARERVWARLGQRARRRSPLARVAWSITRVAAVIAVAIGIGWAQGYRAEVAQGPLPVLYRQEVTRAQIDNAAVTADFVVEQRHVENAVGLRVVATVSARVGAEALPATVELRSRERGSALTLVLGRTAGLAEARPATGTASAAFAAPLPPVERGAARVYEVWLVVETARGELETEHVFIEVTGRPEGERARLLSDR